MESPTLQSSPTNEAKTSTNEEKTSPSNEKGITTFESSPILPEKKAQEDPEDDPNIDLTIQKEKEPTNEEKRQPVEEKKSSTDKAEGKKEVQNVLDNGIKWKRVDNFVYDPLTFISKGNFGTVYKAFNTAKGNKLVALKVISNMKFMQDAELYECFMREIDILRQIRGPHVVKLIDVKRSKNNLYIFMQYCGGGTLEKKMKEEKFTVSQALNIVKQITEAFVLLNHIKIVGPSGKNAILMHRDIKPANLLYHKDKIKIADFGFAKLVEKVESRQRSPTIIGTPYYMSPQLLEETTYTQKCDIWALGIVFYQLIFRRLPWNASSISELHDKIIDKPLKINPLLNDTVKDLLQKMLALKEEDRITWEGIAEHPALKLIKNETS